MKNDKIVFPAREKLDSIVPISNFIFVNAKYFSEVNTNSIGTGPKVWNNITQQQFCSETQGNGLNNQLSHFLQNWNQHNIGTFSGYSNRFLLVRK